MFVVAFYTIVFSPKKLEKSSRLTFIHKSVNKCFCITIQKRIPPVSHKGVSINWPQHVVVLTALDKIILGRKAPESVFIKIHFSIK